MKQVMYQHVAAGVVHRFGMRPDDNIRAALRGHPVRDLTRPLENGRTPWGEVGMKILLSRMDRRFVRQQLGRVDTFIVFDEIPGDKEIARAVAEARFRLLRPTTHKVFGPPPAKATILPSTNMSGYSFDESGRARRRHKYVPRRILRACHKY